MVINMARGEKKKELSLEEKLEQALVPVEEWPYGVPGNWCWVKLKEICEFERGITFPASAKENEKTEDNIACLRTANVQDELEIDDLIYVNKKFMKNNNLKLVKKDDIIMSSANSRELVGKTSYVHDMVYPMTFGGFVLNIRAKRVLSKYLFYMLRLEFLIGRFRGESTQTTNIANINTTILGKYCFPLPPLSEQQRIVGRIESLFAKLDEAKEKAFNVVEQYDSKVNSILCRAFIGDLSCEWRVMYGKKKEDWGIKKIKDVCRSRAGYAFDSKKFQNHGCQIIRMGNLYGGILDLSRSPVFIGEDELDKKIIERAKIENGDILITLTGTKYKRDYGYAVCIENAENLYVNQRILCLTPNTDINRDYLLYYLRSNFFRNIFFSNETGGVNQGNVSSKFVENIEIQVPSMEEQLVIATILKNILWKEEQAKELAECVLKQIDLMKKSILAKAFRGELGTNNPEEESAIGLLKKILMEA
ncbi:MAG: restriction endonuclease subunit S [Blautia sp.]|nr:restriction endonuclease subunit S [Blautia sp.]